MTDINLCADDNCVAIAAAGAIVLLVEMLRSSMNAVPYAASGALFKLACNNGVCAVVSVWCCAALYLAAALRAFFLRRTHCMSVMCTN